jgi:hypothetical protein
MWENSSQKNIYVYKLYLILLACSWNLLTAKNIRNETAQGKQGETTNSHVYYTFPVLYYT